MPHDPAAFVGAWRLVDWRIEYPDGGVTRPFGEGAHGFIVYTTDATMSASIARAGRQPLGQANARNAGTEQKAAAFDSYFHYAGTWHVEGETVVHRVAMALNPDMAGTDQRRHAVFDAAGGLVLSASEATTAGTRRHILQWRRAGGALPRAWAGGAGGGT